MKKILITAVVCIAVLAQPVGASAASRVGTRADEVPVVFDAFIMRPLGFTAMVGGFIVYACGVICPPFILAWRPTDMHKPFVSLVINPFRFTFIDPLGYHPERVKSNRAGEISSNAHIPSASIPKVVPTSPQSGDK